MDFCFTKEGQLCRNAGENRHLYRRKLLRTEIQMAAKLAFLDRIIGEMYNN